MAKASKKKAVAKQQSKKSKSAIAKKSVKKIAAVKAPSGSGPLPYFVHPKGIVDDGAQVGDRTRVWAFAHVLKGAKVGADCNICECVFIESGATLGNKCTVKNGVQLYSGVTTEDYVFIGPNATFTNDVRPRIARPLAPEDFAKTHLSYGVSIGANSVIVAGTKLGKHAMVGAGTVVIRDVPAHALVVGNPARRIGWACACGDKLSGSLACGNCNKRYKLVSDREGLAEIA